MKKIYSYAVVAAALVFATSCGGGSKEQDSIDSMQGNAEVSLIDDEASDEEAPADVMAAADRAQQKVVDGEKWTEEDLDASLTYINLMLTEAKAAGDGAADVVKKFKYTDNLNKGIAAYDLNSVSNADTKAKVEEYNKLK